jgi:hypothetical protein
MQVSGPPRFRVMLIVQTIKTPITSDAASTTKIVDHRFRMAELTSSSVYTHAQPEVVPGLPFRLPPQPIGRIGGSDVSPITHFCVFQSGEFSCSDQPAGQHVAHPVPSELTCVRKQKLLGQSEFVVESGQDAWRTRNSGTPVPGNMMFACDSVSVEFESCNDSAESAGLTVRLSLDRLAHAERASIRQPICKMNSSLSIVGADLVTTLCR